MSQVGSATVLGSLQPVSWGDRCAAFLLDVAVLIPAWLAVLVITLVSRDLADILGWGIVALWLYGRLLDALRGQSPGKALLGFRVVDQRSGGQVSVVRGTTRSFLGLLFLFIFAPINYLIVPLVSSRHQTLNDMIVGTLVVRDQASKRGPGLELWSWYRKNAASAGDQRANLASPSMAGAAAVAEAGGLVTGPAGASATVTRRRRRTQITAVAITMMLGLIVLDWYQRNREMDHLLDNIERSEASMVQARASIDQIQADFQSALTARGNCGGSAVTNLCQQDIDALAPSARTALSAVAGQGTGEVRATGAEVAHVGILPWHAALLDTQDAYVDHSGAWVAYLGALGADAARLRDPGLLANINATFEIAKNRAQDALPAWPRFGLERRIEGRLVGLSGQSARVALATLFVGHTTSRSTRRSKMATAWSAARSARDLPRSGAGTPVPPGNFSSSHRRERGTGPQRPPHGG